MIRRSTFDEPASDWRSLNKGKNLGNATSLDMVTYRKMWGWLMTVGWKWDAHVKTGGLLMG